MRFQSYGARLFGPETGRTAAAANATLITASTGPVLITALTAVNANTTARTVSLHLVQGASAAAGNRFHISAAIAQNASARLLVGDVPLLLEQGQSLSALASGAGVTIFGFGIRDFRKLGLPL